MENTKAIYEYSLKLLAGRRHTSQGLRQKLTRKFPERSESDISQVITYLESKKYLNDNEYAQLFVADSIRFKPQGLSAIKQRLKQKGVSSDIVKNTFSNIFVDEYQVALGLAKKKIKLIHSSDAKKKSEKLQRFLISRGFNFGTIISVLRALKVDADETSDVS
jgi:regulatory protein